MERPRLLQHHVLIEEQLAVFVVKRAFLLQKIMKINPRIQVKKLKTHSLGFPEVLEDSEGGAEIPEQVVRHGKADPRRPLRRPQHEQLVPCVLKITFFNFFYIK